MRNARQGGEGSRAARFRADWAMEDLLPVLDDAGTDARSPRAGRFYTAQCIQCHRFGNEGGSAGRI